MFGKRVVCRNCNPSVKKLFGSFVKIEVNPQPAEKAQYFDFGWI